MVVWLMAHGMALRAGCWFLGTSCRIAHGAERSLRPIGALRDVVYETESYPPACKPYGLEAAPVGAQAPVPGSGARCTVR